MKKDEIINKYGLKYYENQLEKQKKWYKNNKEHISEINKNYKKTFKYRLYELSYNYKKYDEKRFGNADTITKEQLSDLIKNGCYWCGETDWHKLGADRIDNSKPHTLDNCVCGCIECNRKREHKELSKKILQFTLDDKPFSDYQSIREAERKTGISSSSISQCCNSKRYKTAGGYKWYFKADTACK